MEFDISLDIVYTDKTTIQQLKKKIESLTGVKCVVVTRQPRVFNTQLKR